MLISAEAIFILKISCLRCHEFHLLQRIKSTILPLTNDRRVWDRGFILSHVWPEFKVSGNIKVSIIFTRSINRLSYTAGLIKLTPILVAQPAYQK